MIILDTNALLEPLKPNPNIGYISWLRLQAPDTLFMTSISAAEMLAGTELMPAEKRKNTVRNSVVDQVFPLFAQRVLSFDLECAAAFANIIAKRTKMGSPLSFADAAIGAIAAHNGYTLVTRNMRDFKGLEVQLMNPWVS